MVKPFLLRLAMLERRRGVSSVRLLPSVSRPLILCLGFLLSTPALFAAEFIDFKVSPPVASTNAVNDAKLRKALRESGYPSAAACRVCHEQIYNEWRSSAHAYASISPMFHKFEQKINDLSQGTIGTFCLRCHSSVGTAMGERRELPLW